MSADDKIEIENVTSPGKTFRVDRIKFEAMRKALLVVLPKGSPGGEKAGWWLKAAQLDLEAKHLIRREDTKPLRLYAVTD